MLNSYDVGICSSAFGIWTGSSLKNLNLEKPHFSISEFLSYAEKFQLGFIEIPPLRFLKDINELQRDNTKSKILFDCDKSDFVDQIILLAPVCAKFGFNKIRIKTSDILGCERFKSPIPWEDHIIQIENRIRKTLPMLEQFNIKLAIENHQDVDSFDLQKILNNLNSDLIGINWDIGNSLATLEKPEDFIEKFKGKIFNAHLKDYTIVIKDNFYGLKRCVLGKGVIDFNDIIYKLKKTNPDCTLAIELGAHHIRWINFIDPKFINYFQKRTMNDFKNFYQDYLLKIKNCEVGSEIFQKLERNEISIDEAVGMEKKEFEESLNYILGL